VIIFFLGLVTHFPLVLPQRHILPSTYFPRPHAFSSSHANPPSPAASRFFFLPNKAANLLVSQEYIAVLQSSACTALPCFFDEAVQADPLVPKPSFFLRISPSSRQERILFCGTFSYKSAYTTSNLVPAVGVPLSPQFRDCLIPYIFFIPQDPILTQSHLFLCQLFSFSQRRKLIRHQRIYSPDERALPPLVDFSVPPKKSLVFLEP